MNTTVRALAAALLIGTAVVGAGTLLQTTPVEAAAIKTPAVAKLMKEAQAAAHSGNFRLALQKAQQAQGAGPKGGEGAVVLQFIAYAATQAGAYGTALQAYDQMIASGMVNRTEGLRTALRLALRANQPAKALQYANQLGNADPQLVAQINYQQGNFGRVIQLLGPSINSLDRDGLILLQNSYYKTHNEEGTRRVLEALATRFPSADSWREIIKMAQHAGGVTDRGLLEFYRMRLQIGDVKTHEDYFEMALIALSANLPSEAKSILDKAVAAKLLAGDRDQRLINTTNAALAKQQATMAQLQQDAGANPHDGNAEIKLAEVLWSIGKYPEAEQMARRGIQEGNLRDPDIAKIVLGHVLLSQGKRQEASTTFASVTKGGKLASVGRLWSLLARSGVSSTQ